MKQQEELVIITKTYDLILRNLLVDCAWPDEHPLLACYRLKKP